MLFWALIFIGFFLYFLLDVNYFVRVAFTYVFAKYFRKRIKFLEPSAVYGVCLPSDGDFMVTHMNNSRYLREYDFARFDYLMRTGMLDLIMKKGGNFPVAAVTTRYRQPLWMFSPYKVESTPIWWDSKSLYLDQRIVSLSDGVVRGVGYTKIAFVKVDFEDILKKVHPEVQKPEAPADLKRWIEFNEMHSEKMKTNNKNK